MTHLALARRLPVGLGVMVAAGLLLTGGQSALAQGSSTTAAYVANENSNTVSVIDTASGTVTGTVTVGQGPYGVTVNPAGTDAYVASRFTDTVSVIDTATNTVSATIAVGHYPWGLAVNPAGTYLYVTNYGGDTVSVIDTATNAVSATITVKPGPWGVAVNPAGTYVYVADGGGGDEAVQVIDTSTNAVVDTIPLEPYADAGDLALDATGAYVYVAQFLGGTVSKIDTSTDTVLDTFTVPCAEELAVTPDDSSLYVTQDGCQLGAPGQSDVALVNLATNAVTELTDPGLESSGGVAISADGSRAYVGDPFANHVAVIDTATHAFSYITADSFDGPNAVAVNSIAGYRISGFYRPVDMTQGILNHAKAGSTVPVKWNLYQGTTDITDNTIGTGGYSIQSSRVPCSNEGTVNTDTLDTTDAGSSGLRYDPTTDQMIYSWQTLKSWNGTCRQLSVTYDGSDPLTAIFQFK